MKGKVSSKYKDTTLTGVDSLPRLSKEPPLFITQADSNGGFLLVAYMLVVIEWYRLLM